MDLKSANALFHPWRDGEFCYDYISTDILCLTAHNANVNPEVAIGLFTELDSSLFYVR